MPTHDNPNVTALAPRHYSEVEAAAVLNVARPTLRTWRIKGLLAEGVLTSGPRPPRGALKYDAELIDSIGRGDVNSDELFAGAR